MSKEELYMNYFVEFGEYPPVMMMTNGDNEEYLKIIDNAIKSGKRLTEEDIDKGYDFQFDLYVENENDKQFKNFKKGSK